MTQLSFKQRENIGFQYVLEALGACSAYGAAAVRGLRPFARGQEAALRRELDNVERAVAARPRCETAWVRLERLLMQVKDILRSLEKCGGETLDEVELFEIKRFLIQMTELTPLFTEVQAAAGLEGIVFADTVAALELLDPEKNRVASFYVSERYDPELAAVRSEKRALEERLRREDDIGECERLTALRREAAAREDQLEQQVRAWLTARLGEHREAMMNNCEAIARLDLTLQKAKLAMRYGGCKPTVTQGRVVLTEMVNPQMTDGLAARGKAFTPVSLRLEQGVTVITGANMGGKSVALKAAALNVMVVSCGMFAFAKEAEVCLFDSIHLMSEDLEDSGRGLSSFGGEIVGLKAVLEAADSGFALVLMDEFARGTNPHEGAAIARAVAGYLNGKAVICAMTTHYDGVAEAAGAHYQVMGLRGLDMAALGREMLGLSGMDGVDLIARHMNYGLFRVEGQEALPRDAVNICRLLGLRGEVLSLVEQRLAEGD